MPRDQKPIPGSHRTLMPDSEVVGKAEPKQRIEVTVRLRSRTADADWDTRVIELASKHPSQRTYLSREDLAAHRGADPKDLAKIDAFAHANSLTVVEASLPKRAVRLGGTVSDLSKAFGVRLQMYKSRGVTYRGRTGKLHVPSELAKIVEGVFGLDNRPFARPHYRRLATALASNAQTGAHKTVGKSSTQNGTPSKSAGSVVRTLSVPEVAKLYNFPPGLDGTGQCIGLIELNEIDQNGKIVGTGYSLADLRASFKKLGRRMPQISAIGVDGGANTPRSGQIGDTEVTVDINVAGSVAPGAQIVTYFAPDTDAGFIDAVSAAIYDTVRKPSVISISWGGPEEEATEQFLKGLNQVLQEAAAIGVTVCCETGDYGSSDQPAESRDGNLHVEFPSSSPFALACGGTSILDPGKTIHREVVWNGGDQGGAGGGGVSNYFPRPAYQSATRIPLSPKSKRGRGLPDVAGNATGYRMIVGGKEVPVTGTSAVAPLWAGLVALINQSLTAKGGNPVGFLNALIYGALATEGAFKDIVEGNNDIDGKLKKYSAGPGWDACTGFGSPNGTNLLRILQPRS
jgi:kumamolisin